MELVRFKPFENTDGEAVGYLHTPILEMETHRKAFPTVVVCPGGAYAFTSEREADPVALRFFAAGYNVFTLFYSTGEKAGKFLPLGELSETVRLLREKKEAWHTDPDHVAVCGFSAGGHLACSLGTMWDDPAFTERFGDFGSQNRPNAMILCYPVITADEFAHRESIENVSGCEPGTAGYRFFSLDSHVSEKTCPAFLWHTVEDPVVPVENSLKLMAALRENRVPFEAHLFPYGGHGMSVCTQEVGCPDDYNACWMDLCLRWLNWEFDYCI